MHDVVADGEARLIVRKCDSVWWSVDERDGLWKSVLEYCGTLWYMVDCGGVWLGVVKRDRV